MVSASNLEIRIILSLTDEYCALCSFRQRDGESWDCLLKIRRLQRLHHLHKRKRRWVFFPYSADPKLICEEAPGCYLREQMMDDCSVSYLGAILLKMSMVHR